MDALRWAVAGMAAVALSAAPARAATITVTSPGDDAATDGAVTLREAIQSIDDGTPVNADVAPSGVLGSDDRIAFGLAGGAPATITIGSDYLPSITRPATIDGTTQPGATGTPAIGVRITGTAGHDRISATARVVIRGLDADSVALQVSSSGSVVAGNRLGYIGTFGDHTLIGGTEPGDHNVVHSLDVYGSDNVAVGNSSVPDGPFPPGASLGGTRNRIGGTTPAERNLLAGVAIDGDHNVLEGNYIGVDATGTRAIDPIGGGVWLELGHDNVVGGEAPGAGNVISGNGAAGVQVGESLVQTTNNAIIGNRIGTTASGDAKLPNATAGIHIHFADGTRIVGNLISGNAGPGIWLAGGGATHTLIQDDVIGTAADRTTPLGNDGDGILFDFSGPADVVSTDLAAPTVIAGNGGVGLENRGGLIHLGRVRAFANTRGTLVQNPAPTYVATAKVAPDGRTAGVKVTGATPGHRVSVWAAFDPTCGGALEPYSEGVASGQADGSGAVTLTVPIAPALANPKWLRLFVDDESIGTIVPAPTCVQTPPGELAFAGGPRLVSLRQRPGAARVTFTVQQEVADPGANPTPATALRIDTVSKGVRLAHRSVTVPPVAGFGAGTVRIAGVVTLRTRPGATTASWHWVEHLPGARNRVAVTAFLPAARIGAVRNGTLRGAVTKEPRALRRQALSTAADPNAVTLVEVRLGHGPWRRARLGARRTTWSLRLPPGVRGRVAVAVQAHTRAGLAGSRRTATVQVAG